jgi:hypothetical protein
MWPMPAVVHKFVSIAFSPDDLTCCWIEKVNNGSSFAKASEDRQLVVRAYKNYPLNNLELANLILFNPTVIKQHIISFLSEHDLSDAFVAFALHGPAVHEEFVAMPSSTPHRNDFTISNSSHLLWEYRYLYPNDDGQFIFYVYSVPRFVVLQYKLLAVAAQCNLITITTQTMALLSAYQHMFGSAFRRSQLAVDMMRSNNNIGDIITADAVRRMVNMNALSSTARPECLEEVYRRIAASAGLFCSERFE